MTVGEDGKEIGLRYLTYFTRGQMRGNGGEWGTRLSHRSGLASLKEVIRGLISFPAELT